MSRTTSLGSAAPPARERGWGGGARAFVATLSVCFLAACDSKPVSQVKARAVADTSALPPLAVDPALARMPIAARLAREAASRPAHAVRAEAVFSALSGERVSIVRTRQVLGATLGAAYCANALSQEGLALSVCEFADARAAEGGLTRSHVLFDRLMPGRLLVRNGLTVLTLSAPDSPSSQQLAQRVSERFMSLAPASPS